MDDLYYSLLVNTVRLKPEDRQLPSQKVQNIECLLCGYIFKAIPKGKVNNFRKYNKPGCLKCVAKERYKDDVERIQNQLKDMGYILHEEYKTNKTPTLLSNSNCCNRPYRTRLDFVLQGNSICRPCNDDAKRKRLEEANELRYKNAAARLHGCALYRLTVRHLSEKAYTANINKLNPKGKIRKRSGQKGVHLDHIVPIVWCFRNNIPEDICSHPDNLRIINSRWNAKKWSKLPSKFPDIFKPYVQGAIGSLKTT